ncbi:unnamed protein product [Nippostrongylus brasiliensis]|uniref:SHSP domain-containing protein n=1 Tax=Nippostrongylus brasiliensis TaxID=27835 RepID=A0A0N4YZ68_NIPBR|nr:unnamed protein product [Nippostrongylus brasiliensis]
MFNQSSSSPFDDPFFRDRPRFMRSDLFDRVAPMRRLNSCDDALRGVVRNIPIRVQLSGQTAKIEETNDLPVIKGPRGERRHCHSHRQAIDSG